MQISQVWTEKYRPKSIEEMILGETEKEFFSSLIDIPNNLLLVGNPGIGKSTMAKILARKFSPHSYLYINASEQGNVDTVRNLISDFISVGSIDGNPKVVILDECDGTSFSAQQALRSIMEDYLDTVKFILTANYKNKLIEALRSRCQEFNFTCPEKLVTKRIIEIIKAEQIKIAQNQIEDLRSLIKEFFPDIRKTINELQKCCITGSFKYLRSKHGDFAKNIKDDLNAGKDVFYIRQNVLDGIESYNSDYHALMKALFNLYIADQNVTACILISEYMFRHSTVLDPEVNFASLLFNLKIKK